MEFNGTGFKVLLLIKVKRRGTVRGKHKRQGSVVRKHNVIRGPHLFVRYSHVRIFLLRGFTLKKKGPNRIKVKILSIFGLCIFINNHIRCKVIIKF